MVESSTTSSAIIVMANSDVYSVADSRASYLIERLANQDEQMPLFITVFELRLGRNMLLNVNQISSIVEGRQAS